MSFKRRIRSWKSAFTGTGIVKKMVFGYFIIVFVPVIGFGAYYYNQLYENMIEEFANGKQQVIEQAYSNLNMDLLQLESNYGLFQYNSTVIDYLNGSFDTEVEYVYNYLKDVKAIYSYAMNGNSNIENIRFYTNNDRIFNVPQQIVPVSMLPDEVRSDIDPLLPGEGRWFFDQDESGQWLLSYYQNMYAERFSKHVGVFELRVEPVLMYDFVEILSNEGLSEVYLLPHDSNTIPDKIAEHLRQWMHKNVGDYFFLDNKRQIVNHLSIDKLGIRVAVVSQADDVFAGMSKQQVLLLATIAGLLLLLSGMYYLIASSVTKRVLRLARHMRNVGVDNFRLIQHKQDQDEIGYLTSTYNLMLQRMDELVNKIQRSELLRKESAYKVLQAQVKPHFLYNTLETIRMLAESNDDQEVADIAYSFGQLMRYSLSNHNEEVKMSDEVKNVDHYMKIHKMRLGKRVDFRFEIKTNTNRIPCPQFILQPLVENCIVHGLSTAQKNILIRIKIEEDDRYVYVCISDNGVGIPEGRVRYLRRMLSQPSEVDLHSTRAGGHGLYNVSERIRMFYGEDSRMEIESEMNEGTTFRLYLNKKGMVSHVESVSRR